MDFTDTGLSNRALALFPLMLNSRSPSNSGLCWVRSEKLRSLGAAGLLGLVGPNSRVVLVPPPQASNNNIAVIKRGRRKPIKGIVLSPLTSVD